MKFARWLSGFALIRLLRRGPKVAPDDVPGETRAPGERIVPAGSPNRGAELLVLLFLALATACAIGFVVTYGLFKPRQLPDEGLGMEMGGCLIFIACALTVVAKRLVVSEEVEEEYPTEHPEEQQKVVEIIHESGSRITRKRLIGGAAGLAGGALGAALIVPAASFGPVLDTESFYRSPWKRGRRLVDEDGKPMRADDVEKETFYTAYPEHDVEREELAAPLVVVRLDPSRLELPAERAHWAPEGILAYSKICTHAGCAIGLYRTPRFEAAEPAPALVCPCHYSTFNPATGGTVEFGPAGRDLPQLPLEIDEDGYLRAAGDFSSPVGPSFWGVRTRRPSA
jgi:ubiquinol-cytochrome c reductase iron-sulfur subunit